MLTTQRFSKLVDKKEKISYNYNKNLSASLPPSEYINTDIYIPEGEAPTSVGGSN